MPARLPTFEFHLSVARALLPRVWNVGVFVAASTSHATGEDGFATALAQPAPAFQHQISRVSVDAYVSGGEAGKTFHAGLSAAWSTMPSRTSSSAVAAST